MSPSTTHPAASIEEIVVDPDDVIEMMRRNDRDEHEQRTHSLRVSPPFEAIAEAKPHVSDDHARYPDEMDPTPIHLNARALLAGHAERQIPGPAQYPSRHDSRARFEEEADDDAEWEGWWGVEIDLWEEQVHDQLVDEVEFTSRAPEVESTTVSVRYAETTDEEGGR